MEVMKGPASDKDMLGGGTRDGLGRKWVGGISKLGLLNASLLESRMHRMQANLRLEFRGLLGVVDINEQELLPRGLVRAVMA